MAKELDKIEVLQGNGNGKTINLGSNQILNTSDLVACVAILIVDKKNKKCHMIHSDANGPQGIGRVSLEYGIRKLGLSKNNNFEIGLLGGMDAVTLEEKPKAIQRILPKSTISIQINSDSAYLMGESGSMVSSREQLAQKIGVDVDDLVLNDVLPQPQSFEDYMMLVDTINSMKKEDYKSLNIHSEKKPYQILENLLNNLNAQDIKKIFEDIVNNSRDISLWPLNTLFDERDKNNINFLKKIILFLSFDESLKNEANKKNQSILNLGILSDFVPENMKLTKEYINAYKELEIPYGADNNSVKKSFKELALNWHPDKNEAKAEAEAKFKEIGAAQDKLLNVEVDKVCEEKSNKIKIEMFDLPDYSKAIRNSKRGYREYKKFQ